MTSSSSYGALGGIFRALSIGDLRPATLTQEMSGLLWVTFNSRRPWAASGLPHPSRQSSWAASRATQTDCPLIHLFHRSMKECHSLPTTQLFHFAPANTFHLHREEGPFPGSFSHLVEVRRKISSSSPGRERTYTDSSLSGNTYSLSSPASPTGGRSQLFPGSVSRALRLSWLGGLATLLKMCRLLVLRLQV